MITLWTIAGAIFGWGLVETVGWLEKKQTPIFANLSLAYIFGLIAYTVVKYSFGG